MIPCIYFGNFKTQKEYKQQLTIASRRALPASLDQDKIADFVLELNGYFGSPLTIEIIDARKFNGQNAAQVESGSSIAELIDTSKSVF